MRFLFLALLLAGCSSAVLTSPGKVVPRVDERGLPLQCALVNEFDVGTLRKDKKKLGCWCMFPLVRIPELGYTLPFVLSPDEMCSTKSEVKVPVLVPKDDGTSL